MDVLTAIRAGFYFLVLFVCLPLTGSTHVKHGKDIIGLVQTASIAGIDIKVMQPEAFMRRIEQRKGEAEIDELRNQHHIHHIH